MTRFEKSAADSMSEEVRKLFRKDTIGPTGKFPDAKLEPEDQGELKIGVTVKDGRVILAFGKELAWIGFLPDQADQVAALLMQQANAAREIAKG